MANNYKSTERGQLCTSSAKSFHQSKPTKRKLPTKIIDWVRNIQEAKANPDGRIFPWDHYNLTKLRFMEVQL